MLGLYCNLAIFTFFSTNYQDKLLSVFNCWWNRNTKWYQQCEAIGWQRFLEARTKLVLTSKKRCQASELWERDKTITLEPTNSLKWFIHNHNKEILLFCTFLQALQMYYDINMTFNMYVIAGYEYESFTLETLGICFF